MEGRMESIDHLLAAGEVLVALVGYVPIATACGLGEARCARRQATDAGDQPVKGGLVF